MRHRLVGPAAALLLAACATDDPTRAGTTTSSRPAPDAVYGGVDDTYSGRGPRVAVLGDSITVAAEARLRAALPSHALRIAAVTGEGLAGGPLSTALQGGGMVEVAADYARGEPAVAVVALGTNDAWTEELELDESTRAAAAITDSLAAACLVVVTVSESATADGYDRDEAASLNDVLAGAADRVVPWGTMAHAEPGLLRPDGIHPTERGADRLAEEVAGAVRACG